MQLSSKNLAELTAQGALRREYVEKQPAPGDAEPWHRRPGIAALGIDGTGNCRHWRLPALDCWYWKLPALEPAILKIPALETAG
jgi:hypothetical protein